MPTLVQELSAGTIDLAFLMTESVQSANLQTEVLGFEQLVLVAHPQNPLVKKSLTSFKDLDGQVLVYPRTDCDYPARFCIIWGEGNKYFNLDRVMHNLIIVWKDQKSRPRLE